MDGWMGERLCGSRSNRSHRVDLDEVSKPRHASIGPFLIGTYIPHRIHIREYTYLLLLLGTKAKALAAAAQQAAATTPRVRISDVPGE
jgi:hypothetical protein